MCKKVNLIVLFSLILAVFGSGRVLAEDNRSDITTVTTVDFRYNDQAPVGYFEVLGVDGESHVAFCGWHEKKLPEKGWKMTTLEIYTAENKKNEDLRKILWYGFDGPGNVGANYAQTALGVSVALGHMDTDDTGETEGPIGKTFLAKVKGMEAPPKEFQVYCVRNLEETDYKYQCLVYYVYKPNGKICITKEPAVKEVVERNSCYSLENAVYGIFEDESCMDKVGEITTDKEGRTKELELKAGTYYLKEIKAPKGYRLDTRVHKAIIDSQKLTEVLLEEEPYMTIVEVMLSKYDRELGYNEELNLPQGEATLECAEYEMSFYGEYYNNIEEIGDAEPLKQWVMKTDEKGKIYYRKEYVVDGEELWKNTSGELVLPMGTLVVREQKASEGYMVNPEEFLVQIMKEEDGEIMMDFPVIKAPEDVIKENVENEKIEKENTAGSVKTGDINSGTVYFGALAAASTVLLVFCRYINKKRHDS